MTRNWGIFIADEAICRLIDRQSESQKLQTPDNQRIRRFKVGHFGPP